MTPRTTSTTTRIVAGATAGAVLSLALAGCAGGELSVSCKDYSTRSEQEQLDLATAWSVAGNMPEGVARDDAPITRRNLLQHCATNPEDELKDLEYRFG